MCTFFCSQDSCRGMDESFFCDELLHEFEQVDSDYKYA